MQIFANRLIGARIRAGYTQSELAKAGGVSLRSIQNWEDPKGNLPRPIAIRRLCEVLHVDVDWLLAGVLEQPPDPGAREDPPGYRTAAAIPPWATELVARLGRLDRMQRARAIPALLATIDAISSAGDEDEADVDRSPGRVNSSRAGTSDTEAGSGRAVEKGAAQGRGS
jgi:transcriptional regulator with XRE-family HTH domain